MSRIAIFIYGLIAYAVFFVTFLYLFGFAGGFFVPKSVHSGEASGPIWLAAMINLGLIGLFGAQHAVMARPGFKQWWTAIIPPAMERSTFVLIASGVLIFMFWAWRPLPMVVWDIQLPAVRYALHALFVAGFGLVLLSSFLIDHFDLFGLRQVYLHLRGRPYTQRPFVERAIYKAVRHPLMLGFIIAFWAAPTMTLGHLIFAAGFTAYIFIGTTMEERDLVDLHGQAYVEYQQRTPRLFPRLCKQRQQSVSPVAAKAV